jgi:hypothetical protein
MKNYQEADRIPLAWYLKLPTSFDRRAVHGKVTFQVQGPRTIAGDNPFQLEDRGCVG